MNEVKFNTLQPWPDECAQEAAVADRDDVALKTSEGAGEGAGEGRQDAQCPGFPSKLVTIDLLESLSNNPSNIGLLFQVAKAELESIDSRLAVQVARCAVGRVRKGQVRSHGNPIAAQGCEKNTKDFGD